MPVCIAPWMGTIPLTTAGTAYQLSALLAALPAARVPRLSRPVCQFLSIQAGINATGAIIYVGNTGMTTSDFGVALFSAQSVPYYGNDSNLIRLDDIWLLPDTSGLTANVSFLVR